jgi:hypothetical protein
MASIVINGDTSGSVTLQAPAIAGSTILTLPATSGTIQTSGAGYTTNGVAYASSTSVLATGSVLTWDGSNFSLKTRSSALFYNANNDNYGKIQGAAGSASELIFSTNSEGMRLTDTGLGVGTSSPSYKLQVAGTSNTVGIGITGSHANGDIGLYYSLASAITGSYSTINASVSASTGLNTTFANTNSSSGTAHSRLDIQTGGASGGDPKTTYTISAVLNWCTGVDNSDSDKFKISGSDAPGTSDYLVIETSGNVSMGATSASADLERLNLVKAGGQLLRCNRTSDDGTLVSFAQDGTTEGNIVVTGTTVSYNGGHLSRWAQTTTAKDDSLVKGTVLSNLDEMNVYTKDGQPVTNEQLNKVKVSDTEGDSNVAGVFVSWNHDADHNVDEINMAMTGDMIIRIAQGVTVVRGDLLMSAGDGTAKPQGDDIVRSKTVAKVTSNHVTCTYADGSYCVPCVLMAC